MAGRRLPLALGRHGRFDVLDVLGRGGMGVVYRARDRELGRDVALKVVLEKDAGRRQRFLREGQIAASLRHPGIVRVHSAGLLDELPYLACELIPQARPLDEAWRGLELRARLELVRQVADAVGYAHGQGVIHRDLKPENVLVDAGGQAHVADFGLASREGVQRLTRSGVALGTPTHMAPEQIAGERGRYGPATDVWALGVILYQAVSDQLPFAGDSLLELGARISTQAHRPLREVAPTAPASLVEICDRALAKIPRARYPDARAFASDLGAFLLGERPSEAAQRRSRVLAAALVVVGAVTALSLLRLDRPPPVPSSTPGQAEAENPSQAASEELDLEAASDAWRALRRRVDPGSRVRAARGWLRSYPRHPERSAVAAFYQRERAQHPLAVLALEEVAQPSDAHVVTARFLDDDRLLTWQADGTLGLWRLDSAQHEVLQRVPSRGLFSPCMARSSDGSLLVGSTATDTYRYREGELEALGVPGVVAMAASPDGDRIALCQLGERVVVLEGGDGGPLLLGDGPCGYAAACFDQGGDRLLVARGELGYDRQATYDRLELYDLRDGRRVWEQASRGVGRAMVRDDAGRIVVGFNVGSIQVWELDPPRLAQTLARPGSGVLRSSAHEGSVRGLVWRDGVLHSVSSSDGPGNQLMTWVPARGDAPSAEAIVRDPWLLDVDLSPSGELLALGTAYGAVEVWAIR